MPCKSRRRVKGRKKKKGATAFFLVFVFLAVILTFLFAFATPLLIDINTAFYAGGEIALEDAETWLDEIQDQDVKDQLEDTIDSSRDSLPEQIEILGFFYQYGWAIIIIVTLFVIFMMTRTTVETETRYV
jgi:hypothetical protein